MAINKLLKDVLNSLSYEQANDLRERIIELLREEIENLTDLDLGGVVSDLFFTTEDTDFRSFDAIPETEILEFISNNLSAQGEVDRANED